MMRAQQPIRFPTVDTEPKPSQRLLSLDTGRLVKDALYLPTKDDSVPQVGRCLGSYQTRACNRPALKEVGLLKEVR
jgi:hypothetical protein